MKTNPSRHFRTLILTLLAAAPAAGAPPAAHADILAFTTSNDVGEINTPFETYGYTFTLAQPLQVTRLGFWDYGADGLTNAVPVTIWNGGGTALASATVPAGVSAGEINQYLYVKLATSVTLPAGTYTIGGYITSTNDQAQRYLDTITPAAGISYGAPRLGSGNADPTGSADFQAYFGPNFQIVPEPSTWALLALGIAALGLVLRQRRAAAAARA